MSEVIVWEIKFFLQALMLGGILRAFYDFILILREIKYAGNIRIALEDFFYWMICCYFVFGLLYENNNGVLRGFAICGIVIGMAIWHFGPSCIIINIIAIAIKKLKNFVKKLKTWILRKKTVKLLGKALKKLHSWFTIKK